MGLSTRAESLTDTDPCPTCRGTLTWCDCGQGFPLEHLVCLGCGEDAAECECPAADYWRCSDCQCLNAWHESFCYRCGAGEPEED